MNIIQALIMGAVQGLTEFLPISSSAHLSLLQKLFGLQAQGVEFEILLHAATLLALIYFFRRILYRIGYNLVKGDPASRHVSKKILLVIGIAFLPLLPFYLLFKDAIDASQTFSVVTGLLLILFGIPLIFIESRFSRNTLKMQELTVKSALVIGIGQCLALFSGVSRSGITIIAGLVRGLRLKSAKEFAFLVSIPAIAASFGLELIKIFKDQSNLHFDISIFLGTGMAFISGLFALRFLMVLMRPNTLKYFGWYRIILGVILILWAGSL